MPAIKRAKQRENKMFKVTATDKKNFVVYVGFVEADTEQEAIERADNFYIVGKYSAIRAEKV